MKKICFLSCSPFTERDFLRFGIEEIINLGYQVLILDCTPFLEKKFEKKVNGESLCFRHKNIKRCYSIFQLFKNLFIFKPKWCVDFLEGYSKRKYVERVLIRIFLKIISRIVLYRVGSVPFDSGISENNNFKRFKFIIKNSIIEILSLPWKIFNEDKVVVGGYNEYKKLKNPQKAIFAHNLDFDNFKKIEKNLNFLNKNDTLLFLDEDFPCHTDYEREGLSPNIDEYSYFKEISNCLLYVGNKFNLKPIIKLHPRANFEKSKSLYEVPIVKDETVELVAKSNLVVAHCSTAIQLAVLLYKPIILIKPNKLSNNSIWSITIEKFSLLLGIPFFRSEDIKEFKLLPKVNKKKYDEYIKTFIKVRSSENKFSWEIIVSNLFK